MNKSMIAAIAACAFVGVVCADVSEMPSIPGGSVVFNQNSLSRLVTISYTLENAPAIVTVDILTNGVSIGEQNFTTIYGDVNKRVEPGENHLIFWRPYQEWPGYKFKKGEVSVVVKGWDIGRPPDYMVVDLTETNAVKRYYVSPNALPNGGLANHEEYQKNKLVMRRIPAAGVTWKMGSPTTEYGRATDGSETQHNVTFTNDYYIGIYCITWGQEETAISRTQRDANVFTVSGYTNTANRINFNNLRGTTANWPTSGHAVETDTIIGKWRAKTGIDFDLPTSAQWEYACRAGSGTAFCCGLDLTAANWSYPAMQAYAWFGGNSGSKGHACGLKLPNDWGIYDMHGNLWELCLDWFGTSHGDAEIEPTGPDSGTQRVIRGGSYSHGSDGIRSARLAGTSASEDVYGSGGAKTYRLCCPVQLVW